MKKAILFILIAITLLAVVACTQPAPITPPVTAPVTPPVTPPITPPVTAPVTVTATASELKSDKPRETSPATSPADSTTLVDGNSTFALNLYQSLKETGGNIFYSPYSISEALAMTYGGARGETEKQMAATLHFLLAQDKLHPAFNSIDIELAKRGEGAKGKDDKGFRLNVVNAIWGQKDFKFTTQYLDLLAQNYGAGMRIVDYINATEQSRQIINQWVSEKTEGKINDLLPKDSLSNMTRLVLTNAIYFNAAWASKFEKANTHDGQFHLLDGSEVTVPMMSQTKSFRYTEATNYQVVELPYDGRQLSMVVLLPEANQFKAFEAALSSQKLKDIIGNLQSSTVNLKMPRFKIESQFGLKQALSNLGMPVAFSDSEADFSGMDGRRDLYISSVVHKAYVLVDETGTEAAAATGVIMSATSMPTNIKDMTIDHPFILLIRDNPTGTILFIGRVMNPGA
jgi:serpin B